MNGCWMDGQVDEWVGRWTDVMRVEGQRGTDVKGWMGGIFGMLDCKDSDNHETRLLKLNT